MTSLLQEYAEKIMLGVSHELEGSPEWKEDLKTVTALLQEYTQKVIEENQTTGWNEYGDPVETQEDIYRNELRADQRTRAGIEEEK